MSKKIVIAGGNGFIGHYFTEAFQKSGYTVLIIARKPNTIHWNDQPAITNALEDAELLINLAGKSVNCRYTEENKKAILSSRTETTKALGEALLKCKKTPPLWINSSTATIYRHAEDRPMTESNGEIGSGFSVGIAKAWEESFFSFNLPHTRQVALRIAIVLGKNGGVVEPLMRMVRFGFGGKQGSGKQKFSWIHIEDLLNIVLFVQTHTEITGVLNCSSPNPVDNQTLMKTFRNVMNIKIGIPSPTWMLQVGAWVIGTETELLLKSRWVLPERILKEGFVFKYAHLEHALTVILNKH